MVAIGQVLLSLISLHASATFNPPCKTVRLTESDGSFNFQWDGKAFKYSHEQVFYHTRSQWPTRLLLVFDATFGAWVIRAPTRLQTFYISLSLISDAWNVRRGEEDWVSGGPFVSTSCVEETLTNVVDKQEAGREEHREFNASDSELIKNYVGGGAKTLVIAFSGKGLYSYYGLAEEIRFEYVRSLTQYFSAEAVDIRFYRDRTNTWYHGGLPGITRDIDATVSYLNKVMRPYDQVVMIGASQGGFAAILFGSLCVNVQHVIAWVPQTDLAVLGGDPDWDQMLQNSRGILQGTRYLDLKPLIKEGTKYLLYCTSTKKLDDEKLPVSAIDWRGKTHTIDRVLSYSLKLHSPEHCTRLEDGSHQVEVRWEGGVKEMRDNGKLKAVLLETVQLTPKIEPYN
jgi:hypothetical protein